MDEIASILGAPIRVDRLRRNRGLADQRKPAPGAGGCRLAPLEPVAFSGVAGSDRLSLRIRRRRDRGHSG